MIDHTNRPRMATIRTLQQLNIQGELPSPKGIALAILEICRREDASLAEVARVVQTDPALSGRLIRQANSAARVGRPVASVPEAIQHIGLGTVRQLALGFSLLDHYADGTCKRFGYARFWSHSLLMAVVMQELGARIRVGAPDDLFACGLLARIGCLGLATAYPDEYDALLETATASISPTGQERQGLGTDHNELTAALLLDWGIPHGLVEAVFHHESPEASGFTPGSRPDLLTKLLNLAGHLADWGHTIKSDREELDAELLHSGSALGLDADEFNALAESAIHQWNSWGELIKRPSYAGVGGNGGEEETRPPKQTQTRPAAGEEFQPPSLAAKEDCPACSQRENTGEAPLCILLVDGKDSSRFPLEKRLGEECGHKVYTAANGREALALALEVMPQVVITDWLMPGMDGLEFCRTLRGTEWGQTPYVLILTDVVTVSQLNKAFDAGVDDYLLKPVISRDLHLRLRAARRQVKLQEEWSRDRMQRKRFAAELAISNRKLEHAALTDALTDLPNRRAAMMFLDQAWSSSSRSGTPLAVMMADIDHFKRINDEHGHAAGDAVLRQVAHALRAAVRREDDVCRVGGEEFLVICPNADLKTAHQFAERLRQGIDLLRVEAGVEMLRVTLSVGVACKGTGVSDACSLVNAADQALYAAKQAGRGRTCLAGDGKFHCGHP